MTCCACHRSSNGDRLPHGWKRMQDSVYCERCWRERYVVRSVAMPVVEPLDAPWADFREALKQGWVQATAAANWRMTELYARDVRRNRDEKMPRMQRAYLYPGARERFPLLAPQTVATIEQRVQAAYRTARYEVVWTASASLPTYRYPMPLPIHNQSWEALILREQPVVRVRLGDGWWRLRLKGGPRFRRQTDAYRHIVSGEALRGELALYRVRAPQGKLTDRPNADQAVKYAVICKMVAWLRRQERVAAAGGRDALHVRTGEDLLLAAFNSKDEPVWRYHGDHLRRWAAQHRRILQNLADDQKAEQRPAPAFADRRAAVAYKYRNRMRSAVQEIAAQLAGYAARRGFGGIEYDDGCAAFCPEFPYGALRDQVRTKCDDVGLAFRHAAGNPPLLSRENEDPSALSIVSGPPVGPAQPTADELADLTGRGRL
jgi:hypothetical protein